jgi:hypothetical protein
LSRYFNLGAELIVSRVTPGKFFQTVDQVLITGLRIVWSSQKTLGREPNPSTVSVYNLAPQSRALFQQKHVHVQLSAGYDGERKLVCSGDVVFALSSQEGPDWVTKAEVGDGARAFAHARVSRSYRAGVDYRTVLKDVAGSMDLKLPTSLDDAQELVERFAGGAAVSGPSREEMSRLLRKHAMRWSVQDGNLQVLRDGEAAGTALLISRDTGLVGSPEFGKPKKPGKPPTIKIRNVLYPEIRAGSQIQLESVAKRGLFVVERVTHTGDNFPSSGPAGLTEIEARPR